MGVIEGNSARISRSKINSSSHRFSVRFRLKGKPKVDLSTGKIVEIIVVTTGVGVDNRVIGTGNVNRLGSVRRGNSASVMNVGTARTTTVVTETTGTTAMMVTMVTMGTGITAMMATMVTMATATTSGRRAIVMA